MRRTHSPRFVTRIAVACFVSTAWLDGAGLDYLAAHANAVVVGGVTSRVEGPREISFTIDIERVLSGSVPAPTVSVVHSWVGLLRGQSRTIEQRLYGIWFLRRGPSEAWDVLTARPGAVRSVRGLFLPVSLAPLTGPYAYPAGTPLLDVLVYEVAAGVRSTDEDPGLLLGAFDSIDTPAVRAVLSTCLASSRPSLQAVGLAASLERETPGAIQQLARLWPAISSPYKKYVVAALRDSWRDPTPGAVRQLASMAAVEPVGSDVLDAAAWALAAIHTEETLPFLAALLHSASPGKQEQAIYGLSAFANGCLMKTRSNVVSMAYLQCHQPSAYKTADTVANFGFRSGTQDQQSALVSFWRNWWANHPELH